jgi:hypothetical protein
MRLAVVAALTLSVGCGREVGRMSAEGAWADQGPIRFEADARARRLPDGRIELRAASSADPRFIGLRILYDPKRVTTPGRYAVDPTGQGALEIYCIRRRDTGSNSTSLEVIEYEASAGILAVTRVPEQGGDRVIAGSFEQVTVERMGALVLQLSRGQFEVPVP